MNDYERAYEFGQNIGRLFGLVMLLAVAVIVYTGYRVRKQRSLMRPEQGDVSGETTSGSQTDETNVQPATELDEWDRKYLADEITEAEWVAKRRPGRGMTQDPPSQA